MVRAGLIGPKDRFRVGVWDDTSRNAYRQALTLANASGTDVQQAISMFANTPQIGPPDTGRAPLVKRVPNPDDLRSTFQTVARSQLGHVDETLVNRMVDSYTQALMSEQQATYDAGVTGGTVQQTADPTTFAEQQIRRERPTEAGAHDAVGLYNDFLKLWGSNA